MRIHEGGLGRAHDDVAIRHEMQPAAIHQPVHGADDRLADMAHARGEAVHRGIRPIVQRAHPDLQHADRGTGAEMPVAGAGDDRDTDRRLVLDARPGRLERAQQLGRQGIALARPVEGQGRDTVFDLEQQLIHLGLAIGSMRRRLWPIGSAEAINEIFSFTTNETPSFFLDSPPGLRERWKK
jgi:hypothetical protein